MTNNDFLSQAFDAIVLKVASEIGWLCGGTR